MRIGTLRVETVSVALCARQTLCVLPSCGVALGIRNGTLRVANQPMFDLTQLDDHSTPMAAPDAQEKSSIVRLTSDDGQEMLAIRGSTCKTSRRREYRDERCTASCCPTGKADHRYEAPAAAIGRPVSAHRPGGRVVRRRHGPERIGLRRDSAAIGPEGPADRRGSRGSDHRRLAGRADRRGRALRPGHRQRSRRAPDGHAADAVGRQHAGHYNGVVIADNPLDYATGQLDSAVRLRVGVRRAADRRLHVPVSVTRRHLRHGHQRPPRRQGRATDHGRAGAACRD